VGSTVLLLCETSWACARRRRYPEISGSGYSCLEPCRTLTVEFDGKVLGRCADGDRTCPTPGIRIFERCWFSALQPCRGSSQRRYRCTLSSITYRKGRLSFVTRAYVYLIERFTTGVAFTIHEVLSVFAVRVIDGSQHLLFY
jgi:hypothetical protein